MRTKLLLASGLFLFGFAMQDVVLPSPLTHDLERLSTAPAVKVEYKFRVLGEAPTDYQLSLAKPNLFKLTSDTGFTLSDGTDIYTYKKSENTYTQEPVTDDSLAVFSKRPEVFGWSPFLLKKPSEWFAAAKVGGSRTIQDNAVTDVEVVVKDAGGTGTLFLDKKLGVARGYTLKRDTKDYLVTASVLEVAKDATPASDFAFSAPDGAKKVEVVNASDASYAKVQQLMNDTCMPCHDSQNQRSGVDVSTYAGVSAILKPKDSANSLLIKVLRASGSARMPRGRGPMSEDQIKLISNWIDKGAKQK